MEQGDSMRNRTLDIFINIILYIILAVVWLGILFATYIVFATNLMVDQVGGGALKAAFVSVYVCACAAAVLIAVSGKFKAKFTVPLILLSATILAVAACAAIYNAVEYNISTYSRQKWDENEEFRFYMIDDLEDKYELIGKTKEETIDILGEPMNISEYGGREVFEYYIGSDGLDSFVYVINYENGGAVSAGVTQN